MPQKSSKPNPKKGLAQLLGKISVEEYQDFIIKYAAKNKVFKTDFELWFADKDDSVDVGEKYAALLTALERKYSDRGFIHYRASIGFAAEAEKILDTGDKFIAHKDFRKAFQLQQSMLKKVMDVITHCDDSSGSIGGILVSTTEQIYGMAENPEVAMDLKEQIFDFINTELQDSKYFDYGDFGYHLFDTYENLAVTLGKAQVFLDFVDKKIASSTGKYDDYRREFFTKQKISFLKATGKTAEADSLLAQNLDIVEIRQQEIDAAIKNKNLVLAKRLIADGIEIAKQKEHFGTERRWEQELLRIAGIEKDVTTVRHYAKKFAFDRGVSLEYYRQWKKTFTTAEWKDVLEQYIAETTNKVEAAHARLKLTWRKGPPPLLQPLAPIYIEEQQWDRLLELVKKEDRVDTILMYHEFLAKRYPEEMTNLYVPAMAAEGDSASTRDHYASLASKMKRVMKDIPASQEKITALARYLKLKYPRRPAMQEELDKVLR